MTRLPSDVWMCTVCACPTTSYYGAGRYYCCYSCARRDEPAFLLEKMLAEDAALGRYVHAQLTAEAATPNPDKIEGERDLRLLHLVDLVLGCFKPAGYPEEPLEAFKCFGVFTANQPANIMAPNMSSANVWKLEALLQGARLLR